MVGRRPNARMVGAALERWFWRVLVGLLLLVALIALFLVVGSGVGGSGSS
jgi:hypothetical protein